MTNLSDLNESKIKALFKEAIVEVIEENQDLVGSVLAEALEDVALCRAIEEEEKTPTVSREEIFALLNDEL